MPCVRDVSVKLLQYAAATERHQMEQMSDRPSAVRLARVVALSYHSVAIMDGDQKANRGDKKPKAGRDRNLKNIVCRGRTGGERVRRINVD